MAVEETRQARKLCRGVEGPGTHTSEDCLTDTDRNTGPHFVCFSHSQSSKRGCQLKARQEKNGLQEKGSKGQGRRVGSWPG